MSSSVDIDNKGNNILTHGDGPTQGLDGTAFTAEPINSINFTQSNRKFCLLLNCNGSNSFLFVNATEIY